MMMPPMDLHGTYAMLRQMQEQKNSYKQIKHNKHKRGARKRR